MTAKSAREAIDALHRVRLARNLTYEELADDMGLSRRNLFRLMSEQRGSLRDRTLYQIERYLEAQEAAAR